MQVRDIAKQLCQFFVFMLSCILYCLITSPPPLPTHTHTHTPPFICLFSYFRLFASNSPYFGSWLYSCSMNSQTNEIWPQHYIYVPRWVYIPNIWSILKKLGFLLKISLDTCTATGVSKLSCHTHCIVNTQIRTRPLRSPKCYHTQNYPISWKKVQ